MFHSKWRGNCKNKKKVNTAMFQSAIAVSMIEFIMCWFLIARPSLACCTFCMSSIQKNWVSSKNRSSVSDEIWLKVKIWLAKFRGHPLWLVPLPLFQQAFLCNPSHCSPCYVIIHSSLGKQLCKNSMRLWQYQWPLFCLVFVYGVIILSDTWWSF